MDSAQAELLVNSLLKCKVGGWHIDSFLGKGKSAVVLACHRGAEEAAIKVFHPELVERYGRATQLERIEREKSLVGAAHPNLVRILDGGECAVTGHLFVVMEKLPYKNLHDTIATVPRDSIPSVIAQIASAARFLEDRNLAHRDIKPENIAISPDFSRAVLLDLGVLRPMGSSNLTDVDQRSFIGTLRYSSPEFLERREEDTLEGWRAVTFYQIGAVLHDLLMKYPLFNDDSEPFSLLVRAVLEKTPQIHAENAKAVSLANHCLVKHPKTRLELVTWERFQQLDGITVDTASAARDRIRQRQKYFQAASTSAKVSGPQQSRASKKQLAEICNRVESRVAALMNDLQSFPLRATYSTSDVENAACETLIHYDREPQKGLRFKFVVRLRFEYLDDNGGQPILRFGASALMSDEDVSADRLPPVQGIQTAELETLLNSSSFESVFLSALEDAYTKIEQGIKLAAHETAALKVDGGAV